MNKVTVSVFATLHFLRNLQMGPNSKSICQQQAFPAYCDVTLLLIRTIHRLHIKFSVVNKVPGVVFPIFHFLHNLKNGPNNPQYLYVPSFYSLVKCNTQYYGAIYKLWRKYSVANMVPVAVFTKLHFLCNLKNGRNKQESLSLASCSNLV